MPLAGADEDYFRLACGGAGKVCGLQFGCGVQVDGFHAAAAVKQYGLAVDVAVDFDLAALIMADVAGGGGLVFLNQHNLFVFEWVGGYLKA